MCKFFSSRPDRSARLARKHDNHYYWQISAGETAITNTDDFGGTFCLDAGSCASIRGGG